MPAGHASHCYTRAQRHVTCFHSAAGHVSFVTCRWCSSSRVVHHVSFGTCRSSRVSFVTWCWSRAARHVSLVTWCWSLAARRVALVTCRSSRVAWNRSPPAHLARPALQPSNLAAIRDGNHQRWQSPVIRQPSHKGGTRHPSHLVRAAPQLAGDGAGSTAPQLSADEAGSASPQLAGDGAGSGGRPPADSWGAGLIARGRTSLVP